MVAVPGRRSSGAVIVRLTFGCQPGIAASVKGTICCVALPGCAFVARTGHPQRKATKSQPSETRNEIGIQGS